MLAVSAFFSLIFSMTFSLCIVPQHVTLLHFDCVTETSFSHCIYRLFPTAFFSSTAPWRRQPVSCLLNSCCFGCSLWYSFLSFFFVKQDLGLPVVISLFLPMWTNQGPITSCQKKHIRSAPPPHTHTYTHAHTHTCCPPSFLVPAKRW